MFNYADILFRNLILLSFYFISTSSLQASIHIVTSPLDAGSESLRGKISTAVTGDTIIFDTTIDNIPIVLDSAIAISNSMPKDLLILGTGLDATIIDGGGGTHRLFDLFGTWEFRDITFQNSGSDVVVGGAIKSNTGLTLMRCKFISNEAHAGGALFTDGHTQVYNCLFHQNLTSNNINIAVSSKGGAIYHQSGELSVINCTIVKNTSVAGGGGIYSAVTISSLINNIIIDNLTSTGIPDVESAVATTIGINNLLGDYNGSGMSDASPNIVGEPHFVNADMANFRLLSTSPAINTGHNESLPSNLKFDLDEQVRVLSGTVDIGVYERSSCISNEILYVDSTVFRSGDGTTWGTAFKELQLALNVSNDCGGGKKIRVAEGTYYPTQDNPASSDNTSRDLAFYVKHPV